MKVRLKTTFADLEDFRIKILKFSCQAKIRILHTFHFFIYLYDDTKCNIWYDVGMAGWYRSDIDGSWYKDHN